MTVSSVQLSIPNLMHPDSSPMCRAGFTHHRTPKLAEKGTLYLRGRYLKLMICTKGHLKRSKMTHRGVSMRTYRVYAPKSKAKELGQAKIPTLTFAN
jgi:hypothetical protein